MAGMRRSIAASRGAVNRAGAAGPIASGWAETILIAAVRKYSGGEPLHGPRAAVRIACARHEQRPKAVKGTRGGSAMLTSKQTVGALASMAILGFAQPATSQQTNPAAGESGVRRMVTQGLAKTVTDNLFKCEVKVTNHRISGVGTITADDGAVLTVPAETQFQKGQKLPDLFNECNKATPQRLADVKDADVPVVEIDPDGEVVTGYIVADNYFEVYVNGKLVGADAVPFTPFNSAIVKFKAKRPYTYALKLVDWEEKLGVGMEKMPDNDWHPATAASSPASATAP
jgi:hypothetical protein